jgi:NAD(P)-dependent dehydrogenase (short-subunit alcohol dehydrogenase family)
MTNRPLLGKVAIVTAGGFNIGRGIAEAFAAAGARVVIASRDEERLRETAAAITGSGGTARAIRTDVTDLPQVEALVQRTTDAFGPVDVFAAIAGGGCRYLPIEQLTPEDWEHTFRLNVTSTFYCARAVMPTFRARNAGSFLACTGGGGFYPTLGKNMLDYACAKTALCRFVDQLTAELLDTTIRVNAIAPGQVWSPATRARVEAEEARTGKPYPGREHVVPPSAAGELAVWLASDASAPLRGRCVSVYDTWWRDPAGVQRVEQHLAALRVWRHEPS